MIKVTKEQFFQVIYRLDLDVHPRPEKEASYWELRNRQLVGITTPGYMLQGEKTYSLADNFKDDIR